MPMETIFADFNGCAKVNRVRIYPDSIIEGIVDNTKVEFVEGKEVWMIDTSDLKVKGFITFSHEENMWHGEFDPDKFIYVKSSF
jgi:hypothetical protein